MVNKYALIIPHKLSTKQKCAVTRYRNNNYFGWKLPNPIFCDHRAFLPFHGYRMRIRPLYPDYFDLHWYLYRDAVFFCKFDYMNRPSTFVLVYKLCNNILHLFDSKSFTRLSNFKINLQYK